MTIDERLERIEAILSTLVEWQIGRDWYYHFRAEYFDWPDPNRSIDR